MNTPFSNNPEGSVINPGETRSTSLNPFSDEILPGISLFTTCMNRVSFLSQALESWLHLSEVDQIVVVDWSSDESLVPLVNSLKDSRILLVTVPNQSEFRLSVAYNLGARMTSFDRIFKIDCDIVLREDFFRIHNLTPGSYFSGNWERARNLNEQHLNGNAFMWRDDYFAVNGFNETLRTYGWDDTDLYLRLNQSGLKKLDFDNDRLSHIPHSGRTLNVKNTLALKGADDFDHARIHIRLNYHLSSLLEPWDGTRQMTKFSTRITGTGEVICLQLGEDFNSPPLSILRECEIRVMAEELGRVNLWLSPAEIQMAGFDEVVSLYREAFSGKMKLAHKKWLTIRRNAIYSNAGRKYSFVFLHYFEWFKFKSIQFLRIVIKFAVMPLRSLGNKS